MYSQKEISNADSIELEPLSNQINLEKLKKTKPPPTEQYAIIRIRDISTGSEISQMPIYFGCDSLIFNLTNNQEKNDSLISCLRRNLVERINTHLTDFQVRDSKPRPRRY